MKEKHILISPLGFSPGAVSGMAFALIDANYDIERVITVGTSHNDVLTAADYLRELFDDTQIQYEADHLTATELRDIDRTAGTFSAKIGLHIQQASQSGYTVHVGVTGGRSGMGALASIAGILYGADHLWHLWVKEAIEKGGQVSQLQLPLSLDNIFLNPVQEDGAFDLVPLPFLNLRPLHPLIWHYEQTKQAPDPASPFYALFLAGGIRHLRDVFPAGLTIANADRIMEMSKQYPQADETEKDDIIGDLAVILHDAGIIEKSTITKLRTLVKTGATPASILTLIQKDNAHTGFGKWMEARWSSLGPVVSTIDMLAQVTQLILAFTAPS